MRLNRPLRRAQQRGSMLIDLVLYLALASFIYATQMQSTITAVNMSFGTATGQYAVQVQGAVNKYVSDNQTTLTSATPSVAGFVNAMKPTITELSNKGYVGTAGISTTTPLNIPMLVSLSTSNCPGTNCSVTGFAYLSSAYTDADGTPNMRVLGQARMTIGNDGGMSFPGAGSTLVGYNNSYSIANPAGNVAGILAIRVGTNSGFLTLLNQYYKKAGDQLTGTMDANNNDIQNVNNLTATNTTTATLSITNSAAAGAACTAAQQGQVAQNTSGTGLVVCFNTVWQRTGDAVANIADGGACTISGQIGTSATGVAYFCNGSFWSPAALYSTAGTACATPGQVAYSTATRELLMCRKMASGNSQYEGIKDLTPRNIQMARYAVSDGAIVTKPTCATGGNATYRDSMNQCTLDIGKTPPRQACYVDMQDNGNGTWTALVKVKDNTGAVFSASYLNTSAIVDIECAY
jgi:hypothetical protein